MTKIVLDTNMLISALIKTGKPRTLLFEALKGRAQLILSKGILDQFTETMADPEIGKYVDEEDIISFLRIIGSVSKIIKVKSRFKAVGQDPDDDLILRTVYDGKVNYVVSGDERLLSLKKFREIAIVTVSEMLNLLER